jgi:hypothetical protein
MDVFPQVVARPGGPNTVTANAAVRSVTPRPTGRHLLQARNQGGQGGRATSSQTTASAAIKQAVQAANNPRVSTPAATKTATRTGQTTAQVIARPGGVSGTVANQVVTRPAQNQPRGL